MIASLNLRGISKSKDNSSYRWCCCWTLNSLPSEEILRDFTVKIS